MTGGVTGRAVADAGMRLLEAELSLADDAAGRIAVLQKTVDVVREFEAAYQASVDSGERSQLELQRVRYERLTIEIELLKAMANERRLFILCYFTHNIIDRWKIIHLSPL